MIISHSRRYIFIHIHKTGGTSVEAALAPTLAWNDLLLGSTHFGEQCNQHYLSTFGLGKHSSLEEVYRLCSSVGDIQRYHVVSVVREPLERTVSLFNFIGSVLDRIAQQLQLTLEDLHQQRLTLAESHPQLNWPAAQAFLASNLDFAAFLAAPELQRARGFQTQTSQLSQNGALIDGLRWIRTDQLAHATELLSELAGTRLQVPHLNRSPSRRLQPAAVDGPSRQLILERFADDYQQFGFQPGWPA